MAVNIAHKRAAHRTVDGLTELLSEAQAKLESATAKAEQLSKLRNEFETDMATVSGIRRKPNARATAHRDARYDREAAAWEQVRQAQQSVDALAASLDRARCNQPVPFTEDDLKAATHLRDREGWHRIARVNSKTVSVETGYSWTDRIPREAVLEVRMIGSDTAEEST